MEKGRGRLFPFRHANREADQPQNTRMLDPRFASVVKGGYALLKRRVRVTKKKDMIY